MKGYLFYSPSDDKTFVSTSAHFLEDDYIRDAKPRSRLVIEEMQEEGSSDSQVRTSSQPVSQETHSETEPSVLHRSGRVVRQPDRFGMLNVGGKAFTAIVDDGVEDPVSYSAAMASPDANLWQKAMDAEIESMYSNNVWTLVDPPEGVRPIGCKWIYKRKRGPDGNVETFKARLVAKG